MGPVRRGSMPFSGWRLAIWSTAEALTTAASTYSAPFLIRYGISQAASRSIVVSKMAAGMVSGREREKDMTNMFKIRPFPEGPLIESSFERRFSLAVQKNEHERHLDLTGLITEERAVHNMDGPTPLLSPVRIGCLSFIILLWCRLQCLMLDGRVATYYLLQHFISAGAISR